MQEEEKHLRESYSTGQDNLNGNNNEEFPDALLDAGAQVLAQLREEYRREWQRDLEVMQAQHREMIAVLRAEFIEARLVLAKEVAEQLAQLKNGDPGEPGRNGADGEDGACNSTSWDQAP